MGACCSDLGGGMESVGNHDIRELELEEALAGTRGLQSEVQVQLWLSATGLRDKDVFSKSDPLAVVLVKKDNSWEEIGRTEVILNTLNPEWVSDIRMPYMFEEIQPLLVRVYDVDSQFKGVDPQNLNLGEQDFLGEMSCVLSEVINSPAQTLNRVLQEKIEQPHGVKALGSVTIRVEEVIFSKSIVELRLRCADLDNKDLFSKSDPFLRISRLREDGSCVPVYRTDVKKNNLHPNWKPIKLTLQHLCNGDMDRPVRIECFNFNSNGRHDLIGCVQASLAEIQMRVKGAAFELKRASDAKTGGKLYVEDCSVTVGHSFLDYIRGGCELSFMVAVDFTASNGNPYQQDSLHYMDPSGKPNAYQNAISAVGEVLEWYDSDKRFPAWGFGGRAIDGPVSHCFALNGNDAVAEVDGVAGILWAYSQALRHVALAGPTLFAPVINRAAAIASEFVSQSNQKYFALLIITDGVITDLHQTIQAIVAASALPLSIMIVGVGGADFAEMETLDADKKKLATSDGRMAVRDIVQFVPLREVGRTTTVGKVLLAELPSQLVEFMKSRDLVPRV